MTTPTIEQLNRAVEIAEEIAALKAELAAICQGTSPGVETSAPAATKAEKRGISAAGRARIAAAQKKRWAKIKAGKKTQTPKTTEKKKRKMSAAHRAKLAASAKARWAKVKSGKKSKAPKTPVKKKGGITAAGRKKLAASMKARWAAVKSKAGKKAGELLEKVGEAVAKIPPAPMA